MTDDQTPLDASRLTGEPERHSRTYVGDWVWMLDIPDHALRVYIALRAYIFDKDPDSVSVRLTDEEIGQLTHRSISAVKRGRKACYDAGLLSEMSRSTEKVPNPGGKHRVRTVRDIRVALAPPEGFTGPTNCYSELRRIRKAASGGSKTTGQTDQQVSKSSGVSPGHSDGSNSNDFSSNSNDPSSNSNEIGGSDQPGAAPQVPSQVPTHQQQAPVVDETPAGANDNATEPTRNALLADAGSLLTEIRQAVAPGLVAHDAYLEAVADQLEAGYDRDVIRKVLTEGLDGYRTPAKGVGINVRDLTTRLAEIGSQCGSQGPIAPEPPEWCGECDREGRDRPNLRRVEDVQGRPVRCPRCHPAEVDLGGAA